MAEELRGDQLESQVMNRSVDQGLASGPSEETDLRTLPGAELPQVPKDKEEVESSAAKEEEAIGEQIEDERQATVAEEAEPVHFGEIKARKANVVGQINIGTISQLSFGKDGNPTDSDKISLHPIEAETYQQVKEVFVPPTSYAEQRDCWIKSRKERVFVVYGQEYSGKLTCAMHLGLDLYEEGRIPHPKLYIYNRTIRDTDWLIDFVRNPNLSKSAVYVIEDAFENGVRSVEMSSPYLGELNKGLEKIDAYLILTTTWSHRILAKWPVLTMAADVQADKMSAVFDKHLDYWSKDSRSQPIPTSTNELAGNSYARLREHFQWPFQVDLFCRALTLQKPGVTVDRLLAVAESFSLKSEVAAQEWFRDLPMNAKLFAMLAVLFERVNRHTLDEIYTVAVQMLRDEGKGISNLRDSRQIGLNEILEKIHAQVGNLPSVQFSKPIFESEVRRQIVNYHHLLWSLIGLPLTLIEAFQAPQFWELRRDLGAAIGRLGIYHTHKLYPVLQDLALHPSSGVVVVAGYALDEICRTGPEYYSFSLELLDAWVDSGNPDLMWAAGASIWRIYDGLADVAQAQGTDSQKAELAAESLRKLLEILTQLAEKFDHFDEKIRKGQWKESLEMAREIAGESRQAQALLATQFMQGTLENWATNNARSVLHAIRQIAKNHPQDITDMIKTWLASADKDENLRELGKIAGRQLFEENSAPDIELLKERHAPLLDLIGPLLSTDVETVNVVMSTLLVWFQRAGEAGEDSSDLLWSERVHSALLSVVNRATAEDALRLRAGLSNQWLDSESREARRIGQSLIARSYVMDGLPVDMPGHRFGLIMQDSSQKARLGRVGARAGHELHQRIDPQTDTFLVRMGELDMLAKPGQPVSRTDLHATHARPRVLMPALDALNPLNVHFILVLAWGQVVDLDDTSSGPWESKLVLAAAEEQAKYPEKATVISVDRLMPSASLDAVEAVARRRIAHALSDLSSEDWWSSLNKFFPGASPDVELVVDHLNAWVLELDDIAHATHPNDVARKITCAILWLAATHLPTCVQVINAWLSVDDELKRLMGAACGKALFRMCSQADPVPPAESHSVMLELAPLLGRQEWSAAEAVFAAAKHWATRIDWLERLFSRPDGRPSELVQLIELMLPENQKSLQATFERWLVGEGMPGSVDVPESVTKLGEHLLLCLALGTRQHMPDLPQGQSYGLIVVDASCPRIELRSDLANLAVRTLKRLDEMHHADLQVLVYRMGQDFPVVGPGQRPKADVLVPVGVSGRPRLLAPLLESFLPEQVSFVLLLSASPSLDIADWNEGVWSRHTCIYSHMENTEWANSLTVLPKQADLDKAESAIFDYLTKKIGA